MNQKGLPVYTGEEMGVKSRMDKIELIRKGREQYEMLIVTRHVQGEEHFIGIYSSYEEMQKKVNPFIFKYGTIVSLADELRRTVRRGDFWTSYGSVRM